MELLELGGEGHGVSLRHFDEAGVVTPLDLSSLVPPAVSLGSPPSPNKHE